MARIPMTSGFVLIPEGTYVFRIYDVSYDEEFGKIEIKLVTAQGQTHTERFTIKDQNDEYNGPERFLLLRQDRPQRFRCGGR